MKRKIKKQSRFRLLYIHENLNPHQNDTGDCAIRAIAKFLNISWDNAYRMLFRAALKRKSIATAAGTIRMALLNEGCKITSPGIPLSEYDETSGSYILVLQSTIGNSGHAIYVKDGVYYDTEPVNPDKYEILFKAEKKIEENDKHQHANTERLIKQEDK